MPAESKYRVTDAAKILGVSAKTLRRWEQKGIILPARSSGSHRYYTLKQLQNYKLGQKIKTSQSRKTEPQVQNKRDSYFSADSILSTLAPENTDVLPKSKFNKKIILAYLLLILSSLIGFR